VGWAQPSPCEQWRRCRDKGTKQEKKEREKG